ncbi:MAG: hypothetical protein FJX89_07015 [Bacteroidetes bacterium]|nr:hypothetical protein [Bacteroidota bacterium]
MRDALRAQGVKPHLIMFYSIEMALQGRLWSSIAPEERVEV